jgi:cytoskeletal protein CcmA (bactofilin family)
MFRRPEPKPILEDDTFDHVDSVLGAGLALQGTLNGSGGVRIEGSFDGNIELKGLVVVADQGRVVCDQIRALGVIVSGSVRGNIEANRVEITSSGRVWGDVITTAFSTHEGAFLRGQIQMEEQMDLGFPEEELLDEDAEGEEGENSGESSGENDGEVDPA